MMTTMVERRYGSLLDKRVLRLLLALGFATLALCAASVFFNHIIRLKYFLIYNIFLAALPLVCTLPLLRREQLGKRGPLSVVWGVVWMLVFPNAPYMLTDLIHIQLFSFEAGYIEAPSAGAWLGLLYILVAVAVGCVLGCVSLHLVHALVRRRFGRARGWVFVVSASLLTGLGIYIGRFMRFNSWDILGGPIQLVVDLAGRVSLHMVCFCLLFAGMMLGGYLLYYLCFGAAESEA